MVEAAPRLAWATLTLLAGTGVYAISLLRSGGQGTVDKVAAAVVILALVVSIPVAASAVLTAG